MGDNAHPAPSTDLARHRHRGGGGGGARRRQQQEQRRTAAPSSRSVEPAPRPRATRCRPHASGVERLFEMTSDLLAAISLDGRFTLLNPAWEDALGWSIEELMAQPMQARVHHDDLEQTLALTWPGATARRSW